LHVGTKTNSCYLRNARRRVIAVVYLIRPHPTNCQAITRYTNITNVYRRKHFVCEKKAKTTNIYNGDQTTTNYCFEQFHSYVHYSFKFEIGAPCWYITNRAVHNDLKLHYKRVRTKHTPNTNPLIRTMFCNRIFDEEHPF